jgi:protein-disulfide isomerase
LLPALSACGPSAEEVAELRNQQRQVLAKLADIEKKIDQVAAKPAAAPPQRRVGPDPDKQYTLPVGSSAIRGPADAPVTILEFSDYQCPFCARSEPLINDVLKQYPEQVRFVYKHFPLTSIHNDAMGAAKAAVAAQQQGKFWEMHDKIFANQRALKPENLKQYAQEIGLDVAKFEADMNSPEVANQVQEDMKLAQTVQVRGTPTIFVQGKLLQNRSVDGFKQIIDAELKAKGAS